MGALVQQHSTVGTQQTTSTETFSAAVAGNLLLIFAAVSENAGAAVAINTPSGWTLLGTFRAGTVDSNMAIFGKIAAGGETSQAVTCDTNVRFQTAFAEFSGYTLTLDGAISSANSTSSVSTADTGTKTPAAAGRLWVGLVCVKNSQTLTEGGGFSEITVTNEGGAASNQKITVGVYYDLARSTAAREQPTYLSANHYGGMGLLLTPAAVLPPRRVLTPRRAWAGR